MESNLPLDSDIHALEITTESRTYLLEAAKWGRFLAIVGLVFLGLFALGFLFMGGALFTSGLGSEFSELGGPEAAVGGGLVTAYMIFVFAMMGFPLYYLYSFSTKTIRAAKNSSTQELTEGLKNLKSLFKFYGILTAIFVGMYALMFAAMALFGMTAFF